ASKGRRTSMLDDANPSLRLSAHYRIDAVCQRFEEVWKWNLRPRLEDFLGQGQGREQLALLCELLRLELHYRRALGERPEAEEYRWRFPGMGKPSSGRSPPQSSSRSGRSSPRPGRCRLDSSFTR